MEPGWINMEPTLDEQFNLELQLREIAALSKPEDLRYAAETFCRMAHQLSCITRNLVRDLAARPPEAHVSDRHRCMAEEILASLQQQ